MSQEQIQSIMTELKKINEKLDLLEPVAKTYETATVVGKWMKGFLIFVSIVIGVIVGFKNLLR